MTGWQIEMVESEPRPGHKPAHVRDDHTYIDKSPGSEFRRRLDFLKESFPEAQCRPVQVEIHMGEA